jgi:large subunit ribosomal protein L4
MKKIKVIDKNGKAAENLELDEKIFNGRVNTVLLNQLVKMYLANRRQGTAATKTRGEVRGGGRKPWRQKGTGLARTGSIRSPVFKGGGVVFGPKLRDFSYKVPKKMKQQALKHALNAKLNDDSLIIINELAISEPKTKVLCQILKKIKLAGVNTLLVVNQIDKNLKLSARNISRFSLLRVADLNAFQVLHNKKLLFSKDAFVKLMQGLKQKLES